MPVTPPPPLLQLLISDMCSKLDVDGLRGDIVINRAVKALVAYEARNEVTLADVERIIPSCLNHRCLQVARRLTQTRACIHPPMPMHARAHVHA